MTTTAAPEKGRIGAVVLYFLRLGLLGFGGIASTAAGIAQVLFFVFLVLFAITLIGGLMRRHQ